MFLPSAVLITWGGFCKFKVWYLFYFSHCSTVHYFLLWLIVPLHRNRNFPQVLTTLEEHWELFLIFLQFYVYDMRFKTWGPTTFWLRFKHCIGETNCNTIYDGIGPAVNYIQLQWTRIRRAKCITVYQVELAYSCESLDMASHLWFGPWLGDVVQGWF